MNILLASGLTLRSNLTVHTPVFRILSLLIYIHDHILSSSVRQFTADVPLCNSQRGKDRKHAKEQCQRGDGSFPVFRNCPLRRNTFCFQFRQRRALVSQDSRPPLQTQSSSPSCTRRSTRLKQENWALSLMHARTHATTEKTNPR